MVVFNYNPVSAVNYTTNKSKLRKSSSDSDISSSESRGSSPERSANDHHKLKNPFTKLLARLERRSSSNSNDDVDDDEDNDKNNNMYEIDNRNVNEVEEKHVGVPFQKSCNGDNIDDVWANKSPEYEPATPTYIKSQFGKNVTAIKRKSKPPEISPEDAPLPDLPTRPIAPVKLFESKSDALSTTSAELDLNVKNSSSSSSKRNFSSSSVSSEFYLEQNFDNAEDDNKTLRETVTATNMDLHKKDLKKTDEQNLKSIEKQPIEILATNQKFKATSLSSNTSQIKEAYNDSQYDLIKNINPYNYQNREIEISNSDSQYEIQFSRSAVGGSKILMNCHPYNPDEYDGLEFESRFESGNLAKAVRITQTYYQLYLRSDLYTSRSKQWFYFRVRKTRKNVIYRLSIVNLVKSDSLYNDGMRPLMYSTTKANQAGEGWRRCGTNIAYYRNDDETPSEEEDENSSYTLTFNIEFEHDHDTVYFAHSYPYTYSDLQDYLMNIQKDPVKSKICKLRLLCRSLAGNNVYYLTVTAPVTDEEAMKKKKAIVVSARVHPSETPASWMMKGLMDFITGDTLAAKRLRHRFIFKLIPMLNPDGVIVGNTRNSLTGKDLNRQYRTVIRETYPSIWYTKAMVKRLIDEYKVVLYCDMHAHSRKHNIFVYGCENKRNPEKKLTEQVFPLMLHKNVADKFSFESCKFKVQRSKEGTGRIVVWMLGITNSYTIEASFGGSSLGSRKGTHFHTADYEHMGRAFCETLLDYGDDTPNKERLRLKIIERLLKEGSNAEEPLNIQLSDYSSDEGGVSSSENECRGSSFSDLEGPCCTLTRAPPSTPEAEAQHRRHRKPRTRRSHSHRKRSDTRIALDLPTTDPSADLIFSTDEEPNTRDDDNYLPQYCTVPRARRLLQSELQRRYIEEIGDSVMGRERTIMPPELIITSPSKGTSITIRPRVAQSKILPDPLSALEFPVPFQPARRTNSWNNLINGTLKPLCMMRQNSRAPNSYIANERKLDELDLKLSLKKKFWAGVKAEECREATGYQRSLSWNPQQRCQHQSGQQKQIAYERINKSTCEKFDQKSLRKVNREIFLNACSQLIHWQNDQNNSGKSMTTNGHNTSPTIARKIGIHIEALTLGMPEIIQDERTFRTFRNVSQVTNAHKAPTKGDSGILEYKSKRRSNALTKISDTSQLITRLAKAKSKAHNSLNQPTITRNSGISIHKHVGLLSTTSKGHVPGSNRFKTGGYVVTAVQQSSTKKVNKQHHNSKSQLSIGACTGGTCKKDQKNNCVGGTMLSKTNLSIKSTLSSNTFVRKVKAKLTKKKSSQPRGNHSNMTSNNRNLVNVNDIITNKSINGLSLPRII
ncbi:cytosolic carboxypeptidase Nna1 isoform X9 [Eurosta solidaginis]|uniref:cytosolic carboxypeptidase Nna1 isoform X9 n=1 Tax=Eurosta solidaginis TaxID=178769 RepID=UPI003530E3E0